MPAAGSTFRFPHNVQAVLQQIRIGLGIQQEQQQLGDAVALLDDRDRWVEDNIGELDRRITVLSGLPAGGILDWAGPTAPDGFLLCDGAAVSRATYGNLFSAIGTTWGIGDGSSTFNVPDLRGRAAIGSGTGTGLSGRTIAQKGGEESHVLTTPEIPAHTHPIVQAQVVSTTQPSGSIATYVQFVPSGATGSTGGGGSHNNMQPFAVVTKIIKT